MLDILLSSSVVRRNQGLTCGSLSRLGGPATKVQQLSSSSDLPRFILYSVLTVIWWQKGGYSLHVTMSGRHDMDMEDWNPYPNARERTRMGG